MPPTRGARLPGAVWSALVRFAEAVGSRGSREEVLQAGLRELLAAWKGTGATVYRFEEPRDRLAVLATVGSVPGAEDGFLGADAKRDEIRAAQTGGTIVAQGAQPGASVPLLSGGRVVGVLWMGRRPAAAPFAAGELQALGLIGAQLGMLLETWRLEDENRGQGEQLLALRRLGRQMTSTLDIARLLRMVVEEARQLTAADGALLYLLDARAERLALEAWAGEAPPPDRAVVALGYGIPGWVASQGKALRVADRGSGLQGAGLETRRSHLAVPLLSEGRVVGVLTVSGAREEAFDPSHEELLGIFAAQAAKAIEAARFFERVRRERDLRDRILGGTPNAVVALDAERRVVWRNQAAAKLLVLGDEALGDPIERYLSAPMFLEALRRVLSEQSSLESLEVSLGAGALARQLLVNVFPLPADEERGATLILQDLTERRRLDEKVNRMARLASIGQLAAGIAHEIRNPLTGVGISLDVLREGEHLSDDGLSLLDDIGREIDRLEALIRGLLDFARPQPAQKRPMRVAKALEWHRTFAEQCGKKDVSFQLDLRENPKIEGDPEKLKQLFLNLALNALEATGGGGRVRIAAELVHTEFGWCARVTVEDTGRGMDAETAAQAFNPFFTTKSDGTGLGLAIAHSIAEQHGGRIDVESAPGVGTRFLVDLPSLERGEE
ncbi:MAG: GAF domain-containing protein [Deltaproteobacteria bacterium]|nr:GAF domain-containing protein [Deltaproteobacteria bacterium]